MSSIENEILRFLQSTLLLDYDERFYNGDSLWNAVILDSRQGPLMVSFLEERYGIRVHNEDMVPANLGSISRVGRFVSNKLAEFGIRVP